MTGRNHIPKRTKHSVKNNLSTQTAALYRLNDRDMFCILINSKKKTNNKKQNRLLVAQLKISEARDISFQEDTIEFKTDIVSLTQRNNRRITIGIQVNRTNILHP